MLLYETPGIYYHLIVFVKLFLWEVVGEFLEYIWPYEALRSPVRDWLLLLSVHGEKWVGDSVRIGVK